MELGLRTSFYVPDCYIHSHLDGGDQNICIPLSKKNVSLGVLVQLVDGKSDKLAHLSNIAQPIS